MAGVGRVFQGVEYPSRREACQARHREYVRALADGLKSDRCYSADSALVWGRAELELHAELWDGVSFSRSRLFLGGIALLSCQCDAVLSGALVLYLVHCFVAMKPLSPLRSGLRAWVKPPSPLLARNVCFCGIVDEQRCRWFHAYP